MVGERLGSVGLGSAYGLFFTLLIFVVVISVIIIFVLHFSIRRSLTVRRIVSISMLSLGSLVGITGVLILIQGFFALETILGLSRYDLLWWHTLFGIITTGLALIHIYLNWIAFKVFLGLTRKIKNVPQNSFFKR